MRLQAVVLWKRRCLRDGRAHRLAVVVAHPPELGRHPGHGRARHEVGQVPTDGRPDGDARSRRLSRWLPLAKFILLSVV